MVITSAAFSRLKTPMVLASLMGLRMLGLFMILPVFALYGQQLTGATPFLIGIAIGAYGLTQACLQIPFGWWSDRIGRKPVILLGSIIFAVGALIAAQSHSIIGVIMGRAIQGGGAISSVLLAAISDVTEEEQRTKAMAMVGLFIGGSFMLSFMIGPIWAAHWGLSGVFWLNVVLSLAGLIAAMIAVPSTRERRTLRMDTKVNADHLWLLLKQPQLARVMLSVWMLHLITTAVFVALPLALVKQLHLPAIHHGWFYLPMMLVSFAAIIPLVIIAEKKGSIKSILMTSLVLMSSGLILASQGFPWLSAFVDWFLYFAAFSCLEALLPSLASKLAPAGQKGSVMGLFSTAQFLGAFCGGVLGGTLLGRFGIHWSFLAAAGLVLFWLGVISTMASPKLLQGHRLQLTDEQQADAVLDQLAQQTGIDDVVWVPTEKSIYVKYDKKLLTVQELEGFLAA